MAFDSNVTGQYGVYTKEEVAQFEKEYIEYLLDYEEKVKEAKEVFKQNTKEAKEHGVNTTLVKKVVKLLVQEKTRSAEETRDKDTIYKNVEDDEMLVLRILRTLGKQKWE